ncbi:MAG: hypothetical protein IKW15_05150, partial [Bacteroidales bacterium]|nr:hypothetical protein [Bacteroidales bacterium]
GNPGGKTPHFPRGISCCGNPGGNIPHFPRQITRMKNPGGKYPHIPRRIKHSSWKNILFEDEISPQPKISLLAPQFQDKSSHGEKCPQNTTFCRDENTHAAENIPEWTAFTGGNFSAEEKFCYL